MSIRPVMMYAALEAAFPAVDQEYLFLARQLQALSLGVHIPPVCFGIAFPAMVMFARSGATCGLETECI